MFKCIKMPDIKAYKTFLPNRSFSTVGIMVVLKATKNMNVLWEGTKCFQQR